MHGTAYMILLETTHRRRPIRLRVDSLLEAQTAAQMLQPISAIRQGRAYRIDESNAVREEVLRWPDYSQRAKTAQERTS